MKKLMTILCLLCFAGCAYAEMYEIPGSRVETTEEVKVEQDNTKQVSDKKLNAKGFGVTETIILQTLTGISGKFLSGQVLFKQTFKYALRICRVSKTYFFKSSIAMLFCIAIVIC